MVFLSVSSMGAALGCGGGDDAAGPKGGKKPVGFAEVEKTIALGRSGLVKNQLRAATNLKRLALDGDNKVLDRIVSEGGLYPLMSMFKSKSKSVRMLACETVGLLGKLKENRVRIVEEGALGPLLDLLKGKMFPQRVAACEVSGFAMI